MRYKDYTENQMNNMPVNEKIYFFEKCRKDPIFFIENCIKIPTVGGFVPVNLYEPQKEIVREFIENHNIILNKSRQTGGSLITQALCAWLLLFFDNYIIGVISRSGDESSSFNKKVLDLLDNIPQDFIRPSQVMGVDYEERNAQSFKLKKTGSRLVSQAVSQQKPEGILRGWSIVTLVIDEASFIDNIDLAFTGIMPATSQAQRAAKLLGIPYGNFIISTPNGMKGRGEWYYKQWIKACTDKNAVYRPLKIHWRDIPGLDAEWYKLQCDILDNDPKKIAQEMEMQFICSDGSFWSDEIQTHLNNLINFNETDSTAKIINYLEGGTLYIYDQNFDTNKFYLIGVDIASASGSDNSTIQVIDFITCNHVAEFVGKMEPLTFAKIVKSISFMFQNNLLMIENTGGYGIAVLNYLQNEPHHFNIYGENRAVGIGKNRKVKYIPGINTNKKTRPLIIEAMYNQIMENPDQIVSKRLAAELLTLVRKNDKVEADSGYHDDLVMAYAFCFYVRKYAPDSFQDIVRAIERGEDVQKELLSSDEEVESILIEMASAVSDIKMPNTKYGMTESEYKQVKRAVHGEAEDYLDFAFEAIIGMEDVDYIKSDYHDEYESFILDY